MPEICRFSGISHSLFTIGIISPTHFHAIYAEHEALIEIETGAIHEGSLPRKLQVEHMT